MASFPTPTPRMSSPTQSPPSAAARATDSDTSAPRRLRISHPSDASTGGEPKVQHGSIALASTLSLSLDHAISSIAIDPPSE